MAKKAAPSTPKQNVDVNEIARQVAEQIGQQIQETLGALQSDIAARTTGGQQTDTGARVTATEVAETRGGERAEIDNQDASANWRLNAKRTYDAYQHRGLALLDQARKSAEKILSDAQTTANRIQNDAATVSSIISSNAAAVVNRINNNAATADHQLNNQHAQQTGLILDSTLVPGPGEEAATKAAEERAK